MKASKIKIGDRFGRFVVVRNSGWCASRWICDCDCGTKEKGIEAFDLVHGKRTSCGCIRREAKAAEYKTDTMSAHPLYHIWLGIKIRCNPANKGKREFRRYAGRGIEMCARWRNNFEAFVADVGQRPSALHSIDRINNDGNYEPGNVRWATSDIQRRNCIAIHPLEIRGETRCVMDWAKESGLGVQTIYRRLQRGWDPEEAVFHIGWARVDHEDVRR